MNDMDLLREAWDAPEPPARAAHDAARTALLERAAGPLPDRRRRLPRMGIRLVAVGVLAAAIATGVTVVQTSGGGDPVVPGLPSGSVANAAQTLESAAVAAEHRPYKAPRPDQWIYNEYRNGKAVEPGGPPPATGAPPQTLIIERQWHRADGKRTATLDQGKLHFTELSPVAGDWPPVAYPEIAALPTEPGELLALAYRKTGGRGDSREVWYNGAFVAFLSMLRSGGLPPKLEAAIYRAMRKIPGVEALGIRGLTVDENGLNEDAKWTLQLMRYHPGAKGGVGRRSSVMLDGRTYRYIGESASEFETNPSRSAMPLTGERLAFDVRRVATGIVDRPGQRP